MSNRRRITQQRPALPSRTFWNGEPALAMRGTAVVADSGRHPEYWARDLVGERVPVVAVEYGARFYLYDGDGSGWVKVTEGHGSPRWGHRSLDVEPGSFRW